MKGKAAAVLAPAVALAVPFAVATTASAQSDESSTTTYTATLKALNGSGASGQVSVEVDGDQATATLNASGLAETFMGDPYPHVGHIHGQGQGRCPDPSADGNGDGVVSTPEGMPAYGGIQTTFTTSGDTSADSATNLERALGAGSTIDYNRTFTINADTVQALENGNAVAVVHGLDPSGLSEQAQNAKSSIVPDLPLAATSPALCGTVSASQTAQVPSGGVETGDGSTTGGDDAVWYALGGAALVGGAGTGVYAARRRRSQQ